MRNYLLIALLLVLCSFGFADMSDYSFAQSPATYTPITNPTVIHATGIDDAMSPVINIGFTFMLDEVGYTTFRANSNGFITLNPTSTASLSNNLTTQTLILAGLWDDLKTDDTDAHVAYQLTGTSPNQVLTVEFKNLKWYYNATPVNLINYQIKLYQGSNKVEMIYGAMGTTPGASASASIGISGAVAGNFMSITPATPSASYSTTVEFNQINATHVPFLTGNKYEFLPPVPANNDLAAQAITGNTTPSINAQSTYTVSIYNRGANAQSTYTVQIIDAANNVLASGPGTTVASGVTVQVPVVWTPTVQGPVTIRGKVVLAGDENANNDITPSMNISVMPAGVTVVTVGDGSQNARMPLDFFYRNSLHQALYYPTELGVIGNITAVTLYNQFTTNLTAKPTKIWMGMTTQNDLSGGWISANDMTLVYDGTVDYPSGENNILIPLQNIYPYTGGNLVVMFNRPMDTGYFSSSDFFKCQTIGTNRARNVFADGTTYDPSAPTGGTLTGQFAKTSFHITPMGDDPMFFVNPSSKDFGTILIDTSASQTFTIVNGGGGSLTINSIAIAGSPHFSLQNMPTLPVSLGTGQTATFVAQYAPTTEGTQTATISITDNVTREVHTVALTGNCIDTTINALPYTQNFDAVTAPILPVDWSHLIQPTSASAVVQTNTATPYSPPNNVRIYNGTTAGSSVMLVAPPINQSIPMNTVRVKVWVRGVAANYQLSVGVLTDPLDASTYTEVQSFATPTTYTEFVVPLNGYTGTGRFVAFKHGFTATGQTIYVDDISFELIAPNDLAAVSVVGNTTPSVNMPANYTVNVFNNGTSPQSNYQVKLFTEGDIEVGSVAGPAINPGQTQPVVVPWTPTTAGTTYLYGKVLLTGDQNTANDQTPNLNVLVQPEGIVSMTIGAGDQTARIPLDMFYRNSLHQYIIYPAELGNTIGQITAVAIYNQFTQDLELPTKVWIGITTQTDLSAGWIPVTNQTLVFDGNIVYPIGENTITIPFDESFMYLDGGNIVLTLNRPMDTQYYNSTNMFKCQTGTELRARNIFSDSVTYDPAAPPATGGTISGQFAKTTLYMVPGGVGYLTGTVTGAASVPLAGVNVSLTPGGYTAVTNAQGQFAINNIMPNTYQVSFSRYGYVTQTQAVTIVEDQTENLNISMVQMPTVTVSGTLVTSDTGAGISGAGISLTGYENYTASSNTQGQFSIAGVYANQTYSYAIVAPGYQNASGTIVVGASNYNMETITLNEVAYAPRLVNAEIVNNNSSVALEWLAPDPTALDLTESFESATFPPSDWSQAITNTGPANASGVYPTWSRFGSAVISGETIAPSAGSWQAGLWWDYEHQDEWLITPQFNCPPAAYLSFDSHVFLGSTNGDHYYIKISTDGGTEWTILWDASAQTGGWNSYTAPITIDLNMYEGLQVKLAWHAVDPPSNDGLWYVWFIDNIYIGNEVSTISFSMDEMVSRSAGSTRSASQGWSTTPADRAMSRAIAEGSLRTEPRMASAMPESQIKNSDRALIGYKVWRLTAGQETNETSWTSLTPATITATDLDDAGWATIPNGTYRWAVKAVYTSDVMSVPSFSNPLIKQVVNGTIAGVVRTISNQPIAGVTITAGTYTATTNTVGAYSMLVPTGIYSVTATKPGYQTQTIDDVTVNANQTTTVNMIMAVVSNEDDVIPVVATELGGNYPNPFNPETTISYAVKEAAPVRLEIYNLKGQLIRTLVNEEQPSGRYRVTWNGTDNSGRAVSSGIYFYRMNAGKYSSTRKMLLVE